MELVEKMKKFLLLFLFALIVLPFASAITYQQSVNNNLIVSCASLNCSNTQNITIAYPNGSILVDNSAMSISNGYATYTFTTDVAGTYQYFIYGLDNQYSNSFSVTPSGFEETLPRIILDVSLFIFFILLFVGFIIAGIVIPSDNKRDEMTGYIISVSLIKYVKYFLLFFAYLAFIVVTYTAWQISFAYLAIGIFASMLYFLFIFEIAALLPVAIIFIYVLVANMVRDSNVGEALTSGLRLR